MCTGFGTSESASNTVVAQGKAAILRCRTKPSVLPIDAAAIPDSLKEHNRWVGWKWQWNNDRGKWDKPPVNARTGAIASIQKSQNWCSFDEALEAVRAGRCDGIGFVLGSNGTTVFAGIDLDDCRDVVTGRLSGLALEIIRTMRTYTEVSPSGTGIKLLCTVTDAPGRPTKNSEGTVEVYNSGRYFTVTGQRIEESPSAIEGREDELKAIWQKYVNSGRKSIDQQVVSPDSSSANAMVSQPALSAMLLHKPVAKESDGSNRLFIISCRAVEHDLTDESAVATIRAYAQTYPFPTDWTDCADIGTSP